MARINYVVEKLSLVLYQLASSPGDVWVRLADLHGIRSPLHTLKDEDFEGDMRITWKRIRVALEDVASKDVEQARDLAIELVDLYHAARRLRDSQE